MAVGVYLRVSSEEQRERQSIETQREFAARYCELHSLSVYQVYADDGVSGTVPLESRANGKQLLIDAGQSRFDQVLLFKLDRLGRETRLILNAVAELERFGVRIRSMTEEFDTQSATGRLMLTMLSGFAAHERELIRERSVAGTNRRAEAGAWMGGIIPYGYGKPVEKTTTCLAIREEPIPGLSVSEAEVVRMIFRMCAVERKSCIKIAEHLNGAGIPCSSASGVEGLARGKRNRRTAGFWRPSHVRNMIVSRTYMGKHEFGKRSRNRNRKVIVRPVPPIVPETVWQAAQLVIQSNRIMSSRNTKHPYLLRGLIKCTLCGSTFSGARKSLPQEDHYYRCNGRFFARSWNGTTERKCCAKSLNGDYVERLVWADIEAFLRDPGEVLQRLHERVAMQDAGRENLQREIAELGDRIQQKNAERERILSLFRKGRIDEATLDQQLDSIQSEAGDLAGEIERLKKLLPTEDRPAQFRSVENLLAVLRERLSGPLAPDFKRRIIEILVERIEANTIERWGVAESELTITYRFGEPHEPAALVLPKAVGLRGRTRVPEQLNTIGDHLLRRRLSLKLLQRQVAETLGVDKTSIHNWERNLTTPNFAYMPAIIQFLGYNPLPPSSKWSEKLVNCRTALGISQKETAARLGVNPSTLARWERGEREPQGVLAVRATRFLQQAQDQEGKVSRSA